MIIRLKAADPTITPGPSSLAKKRRLKASINESMISGAEDPSAKRLKFATVSFHTLTTLDIPVLASVTLFFVAVIISIDCMNLSDTVFTPWKK
jgi:hypothetical protein